MFRRLGHPSIPFLTAAIAALLSYRVLDGLGLSGREIFMAGFGGAIALAFCLALASLAARPRQE